MCKEFNQPITQASVEARKKWGLRIPEQGEIMRPGKTKRDHGVTPPNPDNQVTQSRARKRLTERLRAFDKMLAAMRLTPEQEKAYKRPGSLRKPW